MYIIVKYFKVYFTFFLVKLCNFLIDLFLLVKKIFKKFLIKIKITAE